MKMLKKLLAVVLTGAMALTLLTACGSNAVTEKDLADALNDMAKAEAQANGQDTYITFTPRAEERELARKIAELIKKESETATTADGKDSSNNAAEEELNRILGIDDGGANETSRFVWCGATYTDELGTSGQAFDLQNQVLEADDARNGASLGDKKPADTRYMGSALCKVVDKGKPVTVRVVVVTAEALD